MFFIDSFFILPPYLLVAGGFEVPPLLLVVLFVVSVGFEVVTSLEGVNGSELPVVS